MMIKSESSTDNPGEVGGAPYSGLTRNRLFRTLILGIALPATLIAVGVVAVVGMGKAEPKQIAETGNSVSAQLLRMPIAESQSIRDPLDAQTLDIEANGVVVPFREIHIAAEVAGRITHKNEGLKAGRFIHQGELLFRIDQRDYRLEVERLARLREQDYAQLQELDQEVANAKKMLAIVGQELQLQEKEIKRLEGLPSGFASATELDAARRARLTSVQQQQNWQNQWDLMVKRRLRLELAEQLAKTQFEQAKLNLERTEIHAPVSGVVAKDMAEVDTYVPKGALLCQVEDTSQVEVSCNLRMDQMVWVLGQSGDGRFNALTHASRYELPTTPATIRYRIATREHQEYEWEAVLSRYEGAGLDPQSRTVACRLTVRDPHRFTVNRKQVQETEPGPSALVRGMFVDVIMHTKPRGGLMLIPKLALRPGNVVWKFTDAPLYSRDAASRDAASRDAASSDAESPPVDNAQRAMDPGQWRAGKVHVVTSVRAIRMITIPKTESDPGGDFWIAETQDDLRPSDTVIVTPLSNLRGDGTDPVRLRIDPTKITTHSHPSTT
jgi:multidrug efflux pump subunit AcrA (membrane-fusion protein)